MTRVGGRPSGVDPDRGTPLVTLRGVTKTFGTVRAVDNLDLEIADGEVVALLGPNGAGKTSTLDLVLALADPTAGVVEIAGTTPRAAVDAGRIAAVTQTGGLLNDLTVADHVRLIADVFGYDRSRAQAVMAQAGVSDIARRRVQVLSGGEKQRLKFAMALVADPDLIILDEPTTGMDVGARRAFWADIHAQAAAGRTVIFATHYLEEANEYADRVIVLQRGRVIADGTAAEVRALAAGRVVSADFQDATAATAAVSAVAALTQRGEVQGIRAEVRSQDSDAVLRVWLDTTSAKNIQVVAEGLEDAFLQLTQGVPA